MTCGAKFLTRNALSKHTRRKSHGIHSTSKKEKKSKELVKTGPVATSFPPTHVQIVVKQVVKLSKQVSISTQTEEEVDIVGGDFVRGVPCYEELVQTSEASEISREGGSHAAHSLSLQPSSSLDFSTQTDDSCQGSSLQSSFDLNDLATQTDFSELLGFGTKCASSQTYLISDDDSLGQYLQMSNQSDSGSILKDAVGSLGGPTSLRTSESLLSLECVGTQTTLAGMCGYEGLGMATQTSPDDFFCPLDEDSRNDFGTQTMDWLNDVTALLPSSYDVETSPSIQNEQSTSSTNKNRE